MWKFSLPELARKGWFAIASAQLGVKFEITDMSPSLPFGLKLAKCAVRNHGTGKQNPSLKQTRCVCALRCCHCSEEGLPSPCAVRLMEGTLSGGRSLDSIL